MVGDVNSVPSRANPSFIFIFSVYFILHHTFYLCSNHEVLFGFSSVSIGIVHNKPYSHSRFGLCLNIGGKFLPFSLVYKKIIYLLVSFK